MIVLKELKRILLDFVILAIMMSVFYVFGWGSNWLLWKLHVISHAWYVSNTTFQSLIMFSAFACMGVSGFGVLYFERK